MKEIYQQTKKILTNKITVEVANPITKEQSKMIVKRIEENIKKYINYNRGENYEKKI